MSKQFVYFYFMKNEPERIGSVAPNHAKYWNGLELDNYSGGPFADRSGGMISFRADSLKQAEKLAGNDPFVIEDLLEGKWVKQWIVD